ncbi:MAG: hypothetical protein HOI80_03540 [Alphaproteobacteria bacterium]|jgi:uncharacterized coiled-coil DUF342 family protein|nr:hypothetical protein [Alphaproteobacteria bacterium]MBT5389730.1 hypothetical protein [Alphaproteobacteria bacterium]MBT5654558.1 hypothetical protein [Alphaproteobacteria bacterium]
MDKYIFILFSFVLLMFMTEKTLAEESQEDKSFICTCKGDGECTDNVEVHKPQDDRFFINWTAVGNALADHGVYLSHDAFQHALDDYVLEQTNHKFNTLVDLKSKEKTLLDNKTPDQLKNDAKQLKTKIAALKKQDKKYAADKSDKETKERELNTLNTQVKNLKTQLKNLKKNLQTKLSSLVESINQKLGKISSSNRAKTANKSTITSHKALIITTSTTIAHTIANSKVGIPYDAGMPSYFSKHASEWLHNKNSTINPASWDWVFKAFSRSSYDLWCIKILTEVLQENTATKANLRSKKYGGQNALLCVTHNAYDYHPTLNELKGRYYTYKTLRNQFKMIISLKKEIDSLNKADLKSTTKIQNLTDEINNLKTQKDEINTDKNPLYEEISEKNAQISGKNAQISEKNAQIELLTNEIDAGKKVTSDLSEKKMNYSSLERRIRELTDIERVLANVSAKEKTTYVIDEIGIGKPSVTIFLPPSYLRGYFEAPVAKNFCKNMYWRDLDPITGRDLSTNRYKNQAPHLCRFPQGTNTFHRNFHSTLPASDFKTLGYDGGAVKRDSVYELRKLSYFSSNTEDQCEDVSKKVFDAIGAVGE